MSSARGENGRHKGLKIPRYMRAGSSPAERTILDSIVWVVTDVEYIIEQRNGTLKKALVHNMELLK